MKIEILHVPDCPNLNLLEERLQQALDQPGPEINHREVSDPDTAAAVGMTGSPTLLIDGVDPFAGAGLEPSLSCRLYPHADGHIEGAPSVDAIHQALATTRPDNCPAPEPCCTPSSALTEARRRAIPADPLERALHRSILRTFAATGHPPTRAALNDGAEPHETEAALHRLHDADSIRLGHDGEIRVAYPFSRVRTRHHVRLSTGIEVDAMCAIDALGIPIMLGTDAVITTHDPTNGKPITVTVVNGRSSWEPSTAVAFVGSTGAGPSAETCCDHLNLFADSATARTWLRERTDMNGELLTSAEAEQLGQLIFGELLGQASNHD